MRRFVCVSCIAIAALQSGIATSTRADDSFFRRQAASLGPSSSRTSAAGDHEPGRDAGVIPTRDPGLRDLNLSLAGGLIGFGKNVAQDLTLQARAPLRYARNEPFKFALGAAGIAALVFTDHWTYEHLNPPTGSPAREYARQLSGAAGGRTGLYAVGGLALVGVLSGSSREKQSAVILAEALITTGLWTDVIKSMTGRERPRELEEDRSEWEGPAIFGRDEDDVAQGISLRSFPSGHSSGAWATATVLAHQYPTYGLVPVLAYGAATAMSYSRVLVGAHWLSDVVAGALLGIGCAHQVLSASARRAHEAESHLRIGVDVSPDGGGVQLQYGF